MTASTNAPEIPFTTCPKRKTTWFVVKPTTMDKQPSAETKLIASNGSGQWSVQQDLQRTEYNQPNRAVFRWVASQPRPFNNVFKELFHGWMKRASMGWKLFKVGFSALSDGVDLEVDIE